ncbi:hypothetical protein B7463_g3140, partial [Scytalidium lignicola]
MGSKIETIPSKRGDEFYSLSRDSKESARLNLQHQLLKHNFGYLLHPSIPIPKHGLRIAEFATGTAIWLKEVSKIVDPDCKLDGYDISAAQFPSPESLPSNISLMQHDILKPLADEYSGYYDIVSVRALVTALADDEWEIAVRNMTKCLKPGGYLQWIDCDLSPRGIKVVQCEPMAPKLHAKKASTSSGNGQIFWAVTSIHVLILAASSAPKVTSVCTMRQYGQMPGGTMSVQQAGEVSNRMLEEAEFGKTYVRIDWLIVAGKKPLAS